jgi:hypothetical protein
VLELERLNMMVVQVLMEYQLMVAEVALVLVLLVQGILAQHQQVGLLFRIMAVLGVMEALQTQQV